jgi:hypothetical protein
MYQKFIEYTLNCHVLVQIQYQLDSWHERQSPEKVSRKEWLRNTETRGN